MILSAILEVVLTAMVTIPELQHGCRKNYLNTIDVLVVSPRILNHVLFGNLLGKLTEREREQHTFTKSIPYTEARCGSREFQIFTPLLSKVIANKTKAIAGAQFTIMLHVLYHRRLAGDSVVQNDYMIFKVREAIIYNKHTIRVSDWNGSGTGKCSISF